MKCQKCGIRPATTHVTEIINGVKNEAYLCQYCGNIYHQNTGFHSIFKNNFDSFFDDFWKSPSSLGQATVSTAKSCPNCGSTLNDIQSRGRLGCSECYSTFADFLLSAIKGIHGSNRYTGRLPKRINTENKQLSEIEQLKAELSRAVENQDFEKAAELRDKIRGMEA